MSGSPETSESPESYFQDFSSPEKSTERKLSVYPERFSKNLSGL